MPSPCRATLIVPEPTVSACVPEAWSESRLAAGRRWQSSLDQVRAAVRGSQADGGVARALGTALHAVDLLEGQR